MQPHLWWSNLSTHECYSLTYPHLQVFCLTGIVSENTAIFVWKFLRQFGFGFVGPALLMSLAVYEQGWPGTRSNTIIYLLPPLPLECLELLRQWPVQIHESISFLLYRLEKFNGKGPE